MKTKDLQSIRTSLEVIKMHTAFIQDSANAMEIEEAANAIQRHVSIILAITGKEEASASKFVPCRTDYHVCASCLQVIRSLAHIIEGESEEDRPFPEVDDAWNRAKDSGLLCGEDHCKKAKKLSQV